MKAAITLALKQQHDVNVTSWYHRSDDEPKAYPKIDERDKAYTIKKIKIGSKILQIGGPKVIMPSHPFQLIVVAERLPTKEMLDEYSQTFGFDSSHLITNDRGQDFYLLLLNSLEGAENAGI